MRDEAAGNNHRSDGPESLICPLTKAPLGQDLRLCQLCKGRRMARRLAELGLTPGVSLRVVQDAGGPVLISVRNSRVALGRGVAEKLQVEVLPQTVTSQSAQNIPVHDSKSNHSGWWRGRRGSRHQHKHDESSQGQPWGER